MESIIKKNTIINYLQTHKDEFKEKFQVEQIGLFGSFARDEANEESDIDIFVNMKPDLFMLVGLKEKIENDLHKKVDVLAKHKHMKPFLLEMINRDIVYV
ncbi:MAG: nucleotidyltransferase domain-containing protein [Sulfurimonas sp.]|nr:nucleotidyltransferase domain-containing protein [Sulfurimonas sp.]